MGTGPLPRFLTPIEKPAAAIFRHAWQAATTINSLRLKLRLLAAQTTLTLPKENLQARVTSQQPTKITFRMSRRLTL